MNENEQVFYWQTTRKIVAAFGGLFSNLYIARFSDNLRTSERQTPIKVPLGFGPQEKWVRRIREKVLPGDKTRVKISVPRISFDFVGLTYNESRKLVTTNHNGAIKTGSVDQFLRQLNPVPYDFHFEVSIYVKNQEDGLQIVEQILPNFTPSYNLPVKDIPELNIVKDISVIFAGITKQDTYEGISEENRILIWTLTFVAKGYLYPVIRDQNVIKKVIATIYPDKEMVGNPSSVITVSVDPLDAEFTDEWEAKVEIEEPEVEQV